MSLRGKEGLRTREYSEPRDASQHYTRKAFAVHVSVNRMVGGLRVQSDRLFLRQILLEIFSPPTHRIISTFRNHRARTGRAFKRLTPLNRATLNVAVWYTRPAH